MEFLAHFHGTRDYFECHELLEEYWKQETDPALRGIWHGLIQVAVALYHERRGNRRGAAKLMEPAVARLDEADVSLAGLDAAALSACLQERLKQYLGLPPGMSAATPVITASPGFSDLSLPVADRELLERSKALCVSWGCDWERVSPMEERELIHRHTLRDRSEVIEERMRRLADRSRRAGQTERDA
ncbi:MAG: hypothetical protein K0R57_2239 [Paenibacillaceae bacterium]|nr:hypothetical protein [Paenibacillaceae bacterium]